MPRVSPPEPQVKDKDRPRCPRCGGVVHKRPDMRRWNEYATGTPRYVCKAGRKGHTCGYYWRQGKTGHLFFEPTYVHVSGLLEFEESPLSMAWSNRQNPEYSVTIDNNSLVAVLRPKDGLPEEELLYACPERPGDNEAHGLVRDWSESFKQFLRDHQDRFVGIPQDVLDGLLHRPFPKRVHDTQVPG